MWETVEHVPPCYPPRVTAWWGAIAWAVAGLLLAVLIRLLPPWRGTSWLPALVTGVAGAFGGGILATVLGFGGLVGFDLRALANAALGALLALLLLGLAGTRGVSAQRARRS
jgi:uncharacterized membrane protein YeaQ/YmgE (transglycosylase-associated protein family)